MRGAGGSSEGGSPSIPWALLVAIGLHAALLEGGRRLPPLDGLVGEEKPSVTEAELVPIDVSESEPKTEVAAADHSGLVPSVMREVETRPSSPEARTLPAERSSEPATAAVDPRGTEKSAATTPVAPQGPSNPETPPGPSPDEYDTPEPPAARGFSPLGGAPLWTIRGAVTPDKAAPAPDVTTQAPFDRNVANRVIASTMRTQDKKSGLSVPAAGIVAGAAASAARSVPAPHNTRATFEVRLGPGGKVLGAKVVSSSAGDAAAWDAAAKTVAASLAKQSLSLGADGDRSGVTIRVSITQKHVFASGTAKGAEIKPQCANGFINEIVDATDKGPAPTGEPKVPMFQDENGRPCIPVGVGGVSDAANLGSQKQITVQSSYQVIFPGEVDLPADMAPVNTDAPWVDRGKAGPRPTLPQKVRKQLRDKEKKR